MSDSNTSPIALSVKVKADGRKVGHAGIMGTAKDKDALVELLDEVMPDPQAALAALRAPKGTPKNESQIQARIESLKKERDEYQDQRSEMGHNPDNQEEQEALYVSVRQCDFAIEQLESLLKAE